MIEYTFMLQRMQSIWLLLAGVAAFLTIKFAFYSGVPLVPVEPVNFQVLRATSSLWILIITIALVCIAVINIFLYKNRKLQGRLAILGIILSLLNIFLYFRETAHYTQGQFSITAILPILVPLFFFLASRGIYKDEKLVKSLDRLR